MTHLIKGMHDVVWRSTEIWCGTFGPNETEDIEKADCRPCLAAAAEYGRRSADRLRELRPPKDCPYEAHADDCDCGGRGGDR